MKVKKIYIVEMSDIDDLSRLSDKDFVSLAHDKGWVFHIDGFAHAWNSHCAPSCDDTIMRIIETVDYGVLRDVLSWHWFDFSKFDESELSDIAERLSDYPDPTRQQVSDAVEYAIYGNGKNLEDYEI